MKKIIRPRKYAGQFLFHVDFLSYPIQKLLLLKQHIYKNIVSIHCINVSVNVCFCIFSLNTCLYFIITFRMDTCMTYICKNVLYIHKHTYLSGLDIYVNMKLFQFPKYVFTLCDNIFYIWKYMYIYYICVWGGSFNIYIVITCLHKLV